MDRSFVTLNGISFLVIPPRGAARDALLKDVVAIDSDVQRADTLAEKERHANRLLNRILADNIPGFRKIFCRMENALDPAEVSAACSVIFGLPVNLPDRK